MGTLRRTRCYETPKFPPLLLQDLAYGLRHDSVVYVASFIIADFDERPRARNRNFRRITGG
jgi:hypothetical protein